MAISFEPCMVQCTDADKFDIRLRLQETGSPSKSARAKSMAVDFRVHPECVRAWGIRSGDKIVGRMEDDGAWVFTLVMASERGYVVRIGGSHGHPGRAGHGFFRFTMTPAQARQVFPESTTKELEFVGVQGREATFVTVPVKSGVTFAPAR